MVSLASLSGCYLVLGAELVALVQLLVYVGAVAVLVLFALMLTRAPIGRSHEHDTPLLQRAAALVVGAATAALLATVLISAFGNGATRIDGGDTHLLATQLFGSWVWPFELLSALLLAAVVAALALARLPIGRGTAAKGAGSPRSIQGSDGGVPTKYSGERSGGETSWGAEAEEKLRGVQKR
jgi:NADH-quinone oxidoreductase subunit J